MAATHGPATHLPAGPMAVSAPTPEDEVREYEKILAINDQVFSGNHPRLKVPQHLVRKSGRNAQDVPVRTHLPKNPPPKAVLANAPVAAPTKKHYNSSQSASARNALPAPQPARVASKPTSEIDPIFLTKSDDLIRAELQLQRQRLERALRDQVEFRKQETKQRPAVQDTKPDFDVSEVFKQALEAVKPVSLSDASEASVPGDAASDSFDENSIYSSRAPDSPPQSGRQQKSPPVAIVAPTGPATRVPVTNYADELQRLEALNRPGSDQEMPDAYLVADQRHPHSQKQARYHKAEAPVSRLRESHQFETVDEPEYSPPAPAAPPADHREYPRGLASGAGRTAMPDARYTERTRDIRKPPSPANVKVVRNHITSPAAPRPSRVSPLAIAKVPSVQQIRDERSEHDSDQVYSDPDSARGSPNAPVFHVMSRKRRRLREGDEGLRQTSHRTQNAEPVETLIKEEPVSPPPFADDPTVVRSRHPAERPIYIDIASPQYAPVYESRGPPMREPVYEIDPYHESLPEAGPQRTISRLSIRRPVREEADLRRVASSQYVRQSDYAREYIEAQPRPVRAASYIVERPVQERPRYYEEAPSYTQHRYIAADDMLPPTYRETYYEEAPPARIMAPPLRRIVVDEHGTQYYELPRAPRLQPMAPPPPPPPRPVSRMSKDTYDERVHHHAGNLRAPSVVQDPYGERHYVQEMPPPQPVYRRVTSEYARSVAADERQGYAAPLEGHEPYSRSSSVQVAEYLPRHAVYVDERGVPQERIIRTASVRPPQPRYENSHEVLQRVGSVRPTGPGRAPSTFRERQPAEYVERPYYIRDRRYYENEDEEGDRLTLDGANDSIQRGAQRY